MRSSTTYAIAHHLVALMGFVLFAGPIWDVPGFQDLPGEFVYLGLALLAFGIVSAAGFGPWGSHYKKLYSAEHKASIK